jgi:hypothetical protein
MGNGHSGLMRSEEKYIAISQLTEENTGVKNIHNKNYSSELMSLVNYMYYYINISKFPDDKFLTTFSKCKYLHIDDNEIAEQYKYDTYVKSFGSLSPTNNNSQIANKVEKFTKRLKELQNMSVQELKKVKGLLVPENFANIVGTQQKSNFNSDDNVQKHEVLELNEYNTAYEQFIKLNAQLQKDKTNVKLCQQCNKATIIMLRAGQKFGKFPKTKEFEDAITQLENSAMEMNKLINLDLILPGVPLDLEMKEVKVEIPKKPDLMKKSEKYITISDLTMANTGFDKFDLLLKTNILDIMYCWLNNKYFEEDPSISCLYNTVFFGQTIEYIIQKALTTVNKNIIEAGNMTGVLVNKLKELDAMTLDELYQVEGIHVPEGIRQYIEPICKPDGKYIGVIEFTKENCGVQDMANYRRNKNDYKGLACCLFYQLNKKYFPKDKYIDQINSVMSRYSYAGDPKIYIKDLVKEPTKAGIIMVKFMTRLEELLEMTPKELKKIPGLYIPDNLLYSDTSEEKNVSNVKHEQKFSKYQNIVLPNDLPKDSKLLCEAIADWLKVYVNMNKFKDDEGWDVMYAGVNAELYRKLTGYGFNLDESMSMIKKIKDYGKKMVEN